MVVGHVAGIPRDGEWEVRPESGTCCMLVQFPVSLQRSWHLGFALLKLVAKIYIDPFGLLLLTWDKGKCFSLPWVGTAAAPNLRWFKARNASLFVPAQLCIALPFL